MIITFTVCTILCFAYWLVLAFYAGPFASQNYIWLIFGVFFACNALAAKAWSYGNVTGGTEQGHIIRLPLWLITALHTLCVVGILIFLVTGILIISKMHPAVEPNLDYVVVLGAKVEEDGTPSKSLKKRLDTAIAYADIYPGTVFVLSGGKDKNEPITEAQAMADYMIYNGISPDKLLLEVQSRNTNENILYSRVLIERVMEERKADSPGPKLPVQGDKDALFAEERPVRIGFLTGDFHMFRTLSIAKHQGIKQTYGISAESDPVLFIHLCFRECLAILKDKFMGNL